MRTYVLCSLIMILSLFSTANAALYPRSYYPGMAFMSEDNSSIENLEKSLKQTQANLQDQQNRISLRLQYIQQLLAAQQALKINWVATKTNQTIPGMLNVAYDGKNAQICRAKFMTGTHPGLVTSSGCLISYAGYALYIPNYDVLVGKLNTQWKTVDAVTLRNYQNLDGPGDAALWKQTVIPVQGGYENNIPLYICKGNYNNSVKIGKVVNDICDVADGPKEITIREFEVLFGQKA